MSTRLPQPSPGPLRAARAVGPAAPAPVCPACNGYGSADGRPCGTYERDFGREAPEACEACGGTGLALPASGGAE